MAGGVNTRGDMSIDNILNRFVCSKEPGALVLQGRWGIGKTYFWRKRIVEPYLQKPWRKTYSYVSLFGVSSLDDLKVAVFQATKEFDYDLRLKWWRWIHPKWLWWKGQSFLSFALDSLELPYIRGGVAGSYNALSFYFVRSRLICFDDIERRGALPLRDFLGLVSQLVDQRNCRIVVILNAGTLGEDQDTWNQYKEKVFQGELTYAPSVTESIKLGLDGAEVERWYKHAFHSLELLKVTNIRVIQRTRRFISLAMDAAEEQSLREGTIRNIAKVVALLTFASAGQADGAPPIEFVMATGPYAMAMSMMNKADRPENEKKWLQILSDYGLHLGDELDQALYNMVVAGYPDADDLKVAIDAYQRGAQREANRNAMSRAWSLYHKRLGENDKEIAEAFELAWPPVSASDHVHNLQSAARVLRLVGRPDLATSFINTWVDQHTDIEEELGETEPMFGQISDKELLDAIASSVKEIPPTVSLTDALEMMARVDMPLNDDAVKAIAEASVDDIVDELTKSSMGDPMRSMKNTLDLDDHPHRQAHSAARERMREAAIQIARRSPLSADRMLKLGVKLEGND